MEPVNAFVEKFDGKGNFSLWKSQVLLVLEAKGVSHVIERDLRQEDRLGELVFSAEDSKANGLASIIIRGSLAPEYANYKMELKAYGLWAELDMLFSSAKASKIVGQLSKLLACKMQPGDRNGRLFTANFKSIVQDLDASDLNFKQIVTLIYLSSLNDEVRPVAIHFGSTKPTSLHLHRVANMVCEHTDAIMASSDQDSSVFAGSSQNSVVCQYCLKSGYTADKCYAIANLKKEQMADDSSSSGGNSSKKPQAKTKKNIFSVKTSRISVLVAYAALSLLDRPDAWLLDSGANASSCNSRDLFTELQGHSGKIMTMSGDHIDIKGRGTAAISKNCSDIGIDNVLYTPDSAMNLLPVSRLTESDLDVLFRKGKVCVYNDSKAMFTPLVDAQHAKEELKRLTQSSSVSEYVRTFPASVTCIPNMTNDKKRRQFVLGLKKPIRHAMDRANPATLEDAFTVALTESIDFVASVTTFPTTQQQQHSSGQVSAVSFSPVGPNMSTTYYSDAPIIISSFDGVAFSPFLFTVFVAGQPCVALFDSGCTGMVLSERLADSLTHIAFTRPTGPLLALVAGPTSGYFDCNVAPVHYDLIVGVPWMAQDNANVDWDIRLLWARFGSILGFYLSLGGRGGNLTQ